MQRLLVFIILISLPVLAQKAQDPQVAVKKAQQSSKRVRKKLNINDSFFTKLEADDDLTTGELTQAAKNEHDLIVSCLEQDDLKRKNKRWLNQYLKIIDRLWDEKMYIGAQKTRYISSEMSSVIGQTTYGADVVRDPNNPDQFLINNFYNIGFKYALPVVQEGNKLIVKKQTYNGSEVSGTGTVDERGGFILDVEVNDGSEIDKCHMVFSQGSFN